MKIERQNNPTKKIKAVNDNFFEKEFLTTFIILITNSWVNNYIKHIYKKINDHIDKTIQDGNSDYCWKISC